MTVKPGILLVLAWRFHRAWSGSQPARADRILQQEPEEIADVLGNLPTLPPGEDRCEYPHDRPRATAQ
jgi:hypothetical protein